MSGQIQMDGMFHLFLTLLLLNTIKKLTLNILNVRKLKMLTYIYKQIYSDIFINRFFVFNRNAFDEYFRTIYSTVRDNLPLNIRVNISTTFHNNNFSTAVSYVSTKMGRDDIRDAKKPYASTNIYNAALNPPVIPLYTNPREIGKLLQLQQWPNCT